MKHARHDRRKFLQAAGAGAVLTVAAPVPNPVAAPTVAADDLCDRSALELIALIRGRKASAREVMAAHLARIGRVNPTINAIVAKLDDDACLALAEAADRRAAKGETPGPLHGLPIAFKDLQPAVGFPLTRGSLIYKDFRPTEDSVLVERLRRAGVVAIGKTNTPEFGMGSHTYNRVYGITRNPYDPSRSAGGSSGGAGAALASGMLPIADGSDMGGSLRNPGNFNNIVGMRPTVGLVPSAPNPLPLFGFSTNGPLARTVADVALLMSVMAGPDPRDPGTVPCDPASFLGRLETDVRGKRIAWCPDLGGLPLDPRVRTVLAAQRQTFEALGCIVEDAVPDLRDADSVFLTMRGFRSGLAYGPILAEHRDKMKPEAVAETEAGLGLTTAQIGKAMLQHGQLLERMRRFEERYDFICCAVNQLPPFDATLDWPKTIDGVAMDHYVAWMKSAYWITSTLRPAISVPAGFTPEGLPVGLQIVGRYRGDFALLQMAWRFEQATNVGRRRPSVV
jgi:amidase